MAKSIIYFHLCMPVLQTECSHPSLSSRLVCKQTFHTTSKAIKNIIKIIFWLSMNIIFPNNNQWLQMIHVPRVTKPQGHLRIHLNKLFHFHLILFHSIKYNITLISIDFNNLILMYYKEVTCGLHYLYFDEIMINQEIYNQHVTKSIKFN